MHPNRPNLLKTVIDFSPIISSYQWGRTNITYSFLKSVSESYAGNKAFAATFTPVTLAIHTEMRKFFELSRGGDALSPNYFSDVALLKFSVSSTGTGDIAIGSYAQQVPASSFLPSDLYAYGGDIWLNRTLTSLNRDVNFYLLHEIGHALGLEHGNNYPGSGEDPSTPHLAPQFDNWKYTIMSYSPDPDNITAVPQGLQQFDIAALQTMYGANYARRADDTVYKFSQASGILTIWDGGGIDKLDASALTTNVVIDLQPGHFSSIGGKDNVAMALVSHLPTVNQARPLIEIALSGNGNDSLTGNNGANLLKGGAGTNTLNGLAGDDILISDGNYDKLRGDRGNDVLMNNQRDGKTTYIFGRGDGHDYIIDHPFGPIGDIDIVLPNVTAADVELHVKRYQKEEIIAGPGAGLASYEYSELYLEIKGSDDTLVLPWMYRDDFTKKLHESVGSGMLSYELDSIQFQGGVVWDIDKELEKHVIIEEVATEAELEVRPEIIAAANNQLFLHM